MIGFGVVPEWFYGFDISLEVLFAIITMLVSINAFRAYGISQERPLKLFGMGFLFLSLAYIVQSLVNILILVQETSFSSLTGTFLNWANPLGIIAFIVLYILGLATLVYSLLKERASKLYLLLIALCFAALFYSINILFTFYLLASLLLGYISIHYLQNFLRQRKKKVLLVLIAFILLLFGNMHFIFSVDHGLYYAIGHSFDLLAYSLLLANLVRVIGKA